jgi:hypothetical protein
MELYFVLDEHGEPLRERDVEAWSRWFAHADRRIARTTVSPQVTVLTIFNGVDDVPEADSVPKLFETRVFGGVLDGEVIQDCTRAEATTRHSNLVEWCRVGKGPTFGFCEADLVG